MIVLLDTNILLDVLQQRSPYDGPAARIWTLVEQGTIDGYISAISFNNVFFIARKQVGKEKALEAVRLLRSSFQIVSLDEQVIDRALALPAADFEDAVQAASAMSIGAEHLVTRNVGDFGAFGVSTVTAEELLAILQP
jgi:predicted nucleic acid-binding protein